ncbi:MAG TPA: peptidoglycan DD-metalloendopeptidase family protein [Thermoanaerobaculia bacterium]|nr:peptidoglycan DD-metalloendopeptidase family protein [Thermoanaerobaculia bacterium]
MGGALRATRAYYAVVPLAIPLLIFTLSDRPARSAPSPSDKPAIDFLAPPSEPAPLPSHRGYVTVEPGDTLDVVMEACGLDRSEVSFLVSAISREFDPRRLRSGQMVRYLRDADGTTREVELFINGRGSLVGRRSSSQPNLFEVELLEAPETRVQAVISAEIESSLWESLVSAGENPLIVVQLQDVFQWDIDFFRLQRGDWFSVVAEKRFVGLDFVGYGPILAARFHHYGQTFEAFRFERPDGTAGYYTANGRPVRKQFLKSPLKFSRVTSKFTHRRYHPVLKTFRPHYGVDYGAPTGTPVMTTADGVVSFIGKGRGEGNWIRIRHNSQTETAYLHLSRFAKGLKKGSKVVQGDVIGYVGSTGLSTAPHLDYRVRERGTWIDPLKLRSLTPDPLRGDSLRQFEAAVAERLLKLWTGASSLIAENR